MLIKSAVMRLTCWKNIWFYWKSQALFCFFHAEDAWVFLLSVYGLTKTFILSFHKIEGLSNNFFFKRRIPINHFSPVVYRLWRGRIFLTWDV